ncbi:Transcriptional regulator containing HTH domain,ArsR family [Halanaeroarchaeum sp. HSR-CO]|uniref:ArsR/SmtB family transcription factor n=1 Tax=Halanaeroarchaeum sp. HSR-CO TaxID=2866382 RepID=UPI00217F1077|nr:helix-turn-helix domain-containing protein [Halanaeroarchaeum sp. HSR-CO]UWG49105.1 Transcriptional regulator containing HTH domain,ArsR family [Halanaeroarchaeum sp. HSR-CO]
MSGLLPSSSEPEPPDGEPRVIGVDEDDAEDVLAALSSETARSLFAAIHDQPSTPSELADRTETSLQNAQYHLEKLDDADLIEVVDTRYSAKGREMNVFGPSGAPVVLFAGGDTAGSDVRAALSSLLGGVGILAVASLAVQELFGGGIGALLPSGSGGDGATAPQTTSGGDAGAMVVQEEAATTVAETTTYQAEAASGAASLPPGLLFFVGGALVLGLAALWWYARR